MHSTNEIRKRSILGYDFIADAEEDVRTLLDRIDFLESELAAAEADMREFMEDMHNLREHPF